MEGYGVTANEEELNREHLGRELGHGADTLLWRRGEPVFNVLLIRLAERMSDSACPRRSPKGGPFTRRSHSHGIAKLALGDDGVRRADEIQAYRPRDASDASRDRVGRTSSRGGARRRRGRLRRLRWTYSNPARDRAAREAETRGIAPRTEMGDRVSPEYATAFAYRERNRPFGGVLGELQALAGQVKIDTASRLRGGTSLDAVSICHLANVVPTAIGDSSLRMLITRRRR